MGKFLHEVGILADFIGRNFDHNADLAAHVDVGRHNAFGLIAGETANGDLLADGDGRIRNHVFDGLGLVVNELLLHQLVEVSRVRQRDVLRNSVREILEVVGVGNEVGFAVDFHQRAGAAAGRHVRHNSAFRRDTASLLGSLRKSLFAQPVNGLVHVAVGFDKRLLAVHHARVGTLAELLDQSSSDIRHKVHPPNLFRC